MQLPREKAVEVLRAIGFPSAKDYESSILERRVNNILRIIDEETEVESPRAKQWLSDIIKVKKAGVKIKIVGELAGINTHGKGKILRPKVPKTRKGRIYHAGRLWKRYGLEKPISEELVSELNERCGKPNAPESRAALTEAWHVLNGYTGRGEKK